MRHILLLITFLLSTACGAFAVSAQTALSLDGFQSDPEASVEILADRLTVSQTNGAARFEGNVVIAQGDMRLSADLVDVTYLEAGGIARLSASGSVLLVSPTESAQADSANYDLTGRELRMRGAVLLNQGPVSLSADLLTIDLDTGGAVMEGRVRTVLPSGSK
ncbi:LptA/OstA family protein [uncultured Planktomarina sp.]|uniref:LptA/OstA family protein n=1 Tax=uncultured Planktomarina sp. TaxID=1538529 RepID=UPI00325FE05D